MRRRAIVCAALALLLLAAAAGFQARRGTVQASAGARIGLGAVVIDAGHGGEDGGAVSATGAAESGINLAIAARLDGVLGFYGAPAVMLRTDDRSLHTPEAKTILEKKRSDLRRRVELTEEYEPAALISIHQNMFTDPRYHGAQVFFAPTPGSEPLAQETQTLLREVLDPDNGREAAPIPASVYLMNHISCRAILVECGFLSNPEEEARLRQTGYQKQIAAVLAAAWLRADGAVGT